MKKWLSLILVLVLLLFLAACGGDQHEPHELHGSWPAPEIEWPRRENWDLEEARLDPDFGAFVPLAIPEGFIFREALRFETPGAEWFLAVWPGVGQADAGLLVEWSISEGEWRSASPCELSIYGGTFSWLISEATEGDLARLVSADNGEAWDVTQRSPSDIDDSVVRVPATPTEIVELPFWRGVQNPVFLAEDLTFEIVEARLAWVDFEGYAHWASRGDGFGVLFGDVLVRASTWDISPEQLWAMLADIGAGA